jgi:hypothetical protein
VATLKIGIRARRAAAIERHTDTINNFSSKLQQILKKAVCVAKVCQHHRTFNIFGRFLFRTLTAEQIRRLMICALPFPSSLNKHWGLSHNTITEPSIGRCIDCRSAATIILITAAAFRSLRASQPVSQSVSVRHIHLGDSRCAFMAKSNMTKHNCTVLHNEERHRN